MRAEIISIGTELLLGEITDTNASYLAGQLPHLGMDLYWISQVGDNQARLVEVLKRAWRRSELILTSGGLGPTEDDLTREAIAEVLNEKLEVDPVLEAELRSWFDRLDLSMPLSNLKQATLIPSAEPIRNARGTAPGWWVEKEGRILVALPGPPAELQEMWQKTVQVKLKRGSMAVILSRTLKCFGLGEATVGELVSPLLSSVNPTLAVYAKADGIHLRLTAKAKNEKRAEKIIAEGEAQVRVIVGEYVWGTDDETLETVVANRLIEKGLTLAIMEDYSGGRLAATITSIPEYPAFFKGGLVAPSDETKIAFGIDGELISQYGADSPEVTQAMAEAASAFFKADIGLGISGRGKAGTTGMVHIGIADARGCRVIRRQARRPIITTALFELRSSLIP
jgi:nicotinamide-nucleotide amidase